MEDNVNHKEVETTVLCFKSGTVKSNINNLDSDASSSRPQTGVSGGPTAIISDFVVSRNREACSNVSVLGNEDHEGASSQKSVENSLNNTTEVQSLPKISEVECFATSEEGDNIKGSQVFITKFEDIHEAREVQKSDASNPPWGCDPSGYDRPITVFTRRRQSSSDSVDSDSSSSSSSSSSSDWDSSSDTALVSDEDSVKQALPGPCAKPRRVVQPAVKNKGEFTLDDLPPIEDLLISMPEHECKELGKVVSIIDKLAVVEPHRDMPTLNLDSVLFLDHGKRAMGHVFDVFGQVKEPLYCVRFNSTDHIRESGISVGTKVYCAPDTPYTNYVFVNQLMSMRGSDASWEQDNEPPASAVFYSDDEEEREARRKVQHEKSKLRTGEGADGSPAVPEPKPKRLNLMEERNNRRNLLLNAAYSCTSQHGRRQARGRGWVAPSPDDFIIKPSSFSFTPDWPPPTQDSRPESKPRLQPPSSSPAASSPLFGICRPPQFPFSSSRFSVPPPLSAGKNLFGVLRSQPTEMLTFMQPAPSIQAPVRTFVGSGGLQFASTQHPPSMPSSSARPPDATAILPRPFGSPAGPISFGPVPCPPSVLTSPPPPFGVSFNIMQRPPNFPTGRLTTSTVCRPFRPPSCVSGMASQQREFSDAASPKPVMFNPSQPPPNLPCSSPATCVSFGSVSHSPAFGPVSRVLLSSGPNLNTTLAQGAMNQQPGCSNLPFNPSQRPSGPQQSSSSVFGTPWLRDPWNTSTGSSRSTGAWQAPSPTPRLPSDVWQSRDIWQPQVSGTTPCTSWQVPNSPWRLPGTSQQPAGPPWQTCNQHLGPGRPTPTQFDVLRLRSPPPLPPSPESSFYR